MAQPLEPGVFTAVFERLAGQVGKATGAALVSMALAIERRAKQNLNQSTHPYGTRSPAAAGGPPALVSGTLRRSVTHNPPTEAGGVWEVKVGLANNFYPPYPRHGKRTRSSLYGFYLETGLRNGTRYPFLVPAFRAVVAEQRGARLGALIEAGWHTP